MKLSQSFVAASLSVAVRSTTARVIPEPAELNILSPQASELPLDGPKPARMIPRGFGRRAPPFMFHAKSDDSPQATSPKSKRQVQAPPVSTAGAGALVSNVAGGLVAGLPVVGAPLSGVLGSLPLPALGDAVAGSLGSLPIDGIAQPVVDQATGVVGDLRTAEGPLLGNVGGQVSSLLGTAVGTLQGLPVVGDLAKILPLDSLSQGDSLAKIVNTVSGTVSALPAVGAPLAQTLNSVGSLTQALPLSHAALPDSRTVAQPTYSYNQMSVTASMLGAAGGAFPIQPSRSLDGATLPNDTNPPNDILPQARFHNATDYPQANQPLQKRQYSEDNDYTQNEGSPEDGQVEEDPVHIQMQPYSEDDQITNENPEKFQPEDNTGNVQSQESSTVDGNSGEPKKEQQPVYSQMERSSQDDHFVQNSEEIQPEENNRNVQSQQSSTDDRTSGESQDDCHVRFQDSKQSRNQDHSSTLPNDSTQLKGILINPKTHKPANPSTDFLTNNAHGPSVPNLFPAKIPFREVYASAKNFPGRTLRKRSPQLAFVRGPAPSNFGFFSTLSPVHDSKMEEMSSMTKTPLLNVQTPSGNIKSWWKRRVSKISRE